MGKQKENNMDLYQNRKLKDIRARLAELKRLEQEHQAVQGQIETQRDKEPKSSNSFSNQLSPTAPNCTLDLTFHAGKTSTVDSFDIVDQFHTSLSHQVAHTEPFTTHGTKTPPNTTGATTTSDGKDSSVGLFDEEEAETKDDESFDVDAEIERLSQ